MKEGFIWYNDKATHVQIIKEHSFNHLILKTDGDILEMPPEDYRPIWKTKEECEYRHDIYYTFVPQ